MKKILMIGLIVAALSACGQKTAMNDNHNTAPANIPALAPAAESPIPTPMIPKDGNYTGRGKVTRINIRLRSIEIDHDDIPDMMPAMKMEFYVKDIALLSGLSVGDTVEFVIEYKHPTETITAIKKTK